MAVLWCNGCRAFHHTTASGRELRARVAWYGARSAQLGRPERHSRGPQQAWAWPILPPASSATSRNARRQKRL